MAQTLALLQERESASEKVSHVNPVSDRTTRATGEKPASAGRF
jgi:hypothetical protein